MHTQIISVHRTSLKYTLQQSTIIKITFTVTRLSPFTVSVYLLILTKYSGRMRDNHPTSSETSVCIMFVHRCGQTLTTSHGIGHPRQIMTVFTNDNVYIQTESPRTSTD